MTMKTFIVNYKRPLDSSDFALSIAKIEHMRIIAIGSFAAQRIFKSKRINKGTVITSVISLQEYNKITAQIKAEFNRLTSRI